MSDGGEGAGKGATETTVGTVAIETAPGISETASLYTPEVSETAVGPAGTANLYRPETVYAVGTAPDAIETPRVEGERDLSADLALCRSAQGGKWMVMKPLHGYSVVDGPPPHPWRGNWSVCHCSDEANAKMIAASREGWEHAILRAMAAEARLKVLEGG